MEEKDNWVIEEKYGIFEIMPHDALRFKRMSYGYEETHGHNLNALDCLETASTTQELHDWLEKNKEDYHGSRFVILPIFDVEFKIE